MTSLCERKILAMRFALLDAPGSMGDALCDTFDAEVVGAVDAEDLVVWDEVLVDMVAEFAGET